MSQFQRIETSSLIFCRVLFENVLAEVYGALVNVLLKLNINSCSRDINLSDGAWKIILI